MPLRQRQRTRSAAATAAAATLLALALTVRPAAACPRTELGFCSGHGYCNIFVCDCYKGWEKSACEHRVCPSGKAWQDQALATDQGHNDAVCSNRGLCNTATGTCTCQAGFEGHACQRLACPLKCSGRGACVSMKRLVQLRYDTMAYTSVWDSEKTFGCLCDRGYHGYDCSLIECAVGDDPKTTPQPVGLSVSAKAPTGTCSTAAVVNTLTIQQDGQCNEVQYIVCKQTSGGFYVSFDGVSSNVILFDDTVAVAAQKIKAITTLGGSHAHSAANIISRTHHSYSGGDVVCNAAGEIALEVEFLQKFGDLEAMRITDSVGQRMATTGADVTVYCDTSNLYFTCAASTVPNICLQSGCADGDTLKAIRGTKENKICSGRGVCQATGQCKCSGTTQAGFVSSDGKGGPGLRNDCGAQVGVIFACPGEVACSAHGTCSGGSGDSLYVCSCFAGWQGADCSERTCDSGNAWFGAPSATNQAHSPVECSNKGICDRSTGLCTCEAGYTGSACDILACPVAAAFADAAVVCSGHGECHTMKELATHTLLNGVDTSFTYGAVPNDPLRWDAEKIKGCLCDDGWGGIDCSEMLCPYGDNPQTPGLAEIQTVQLTPQADVAATETVLLKFRRDTATLLAGDTAAQVQQKLRALPSMKSFPSITDGVNVTMDTAALVVDGATTTTLTLRYDFVYGDLPPVQFVATGTANVTAAVATTRDGTHEFEECSGKGLCDTATGLCTCREGWSSSDGKHGKGSIANCGYLMPIIPVAS